MPLSASLRRSPRFLTVKNFSKLLHEEAKESSRIFLNLGAFGPINASLGKGPRKGINLPETAYTLGGTQGTPPGFSPSIYKDSIIETMKILRTSFPKSTSMQYANFMPGEWLPDNEPRLPK